MEFNVDARGMACPMPVVVTKNMLNSAKTGDVVVTTVDNEIAVQNLTKFAGQKNYLCESEKADDKKYMVRITVGDNVPAAQKQGTPTTSAPAENTDSIPCRTDAREKGQLVVISANVMGTGDETLGKNLMKAFIYALTQEEVLPERILLYNTGAYLSCEGSESLLDLKSLEALGVEIMTCGTCLNYYQIADKLAVGSVTNMYDIVSSMQNATKLIRP